MGCKRIDFIYSKDTNGKGTQDEVVDSIPLNNTFVPLKSNKNILKACSFHKFGLLCSSKYANNNLTLRAEHFTGNEKVLHSVVFEFNSDGSLKDKKSLSFQSDPLTKAPSSNDNTCKLLNGYYSKPFAMTYEQSSCDSLTIIQHREQDVVDHITLNNKFSVLSSMPQFNTACTYNSQRRVVLCASYFNRINGTLARIFTMEQTSTSVFNFNYSFNPEGQLVDVFAFFQDQ